MSNAGANDEYKLKVVRFIIKVLDTLNSELIERGETKVSFDVMLAQKVKDGIRAHSISSILEMLQNTVLGNSNLFSKEEVKKVLDILAQLIDWNDLA